MVAVEGLHASAFIGSLTPAPEVTLHNYMKNDII
jgi:hypothetical protein